MRPLLAKDLPLFMQRFDNFKDGEFRSLEVISPTSMKLIFAVQDRAKEFDWISLELEFEGVSDARLLDTSKLHFLDMSDGVNIISEEKSYAFGIGNYHNITNMKDSISYVISSSLKYKENSF
ncbi:MAG: hypothetical protein QM497_10640 [Sulfurimonas sp.]